MNHPAKIAVLCASVALAACSSLETERIDYRSTAKAPTLDVPPDLTQLSRDNRYAIPGGVVTASGYMAGSAAPAQGPSVAANSIGDVRVERVGNQRWLVVNRSADKLWPTLNEFWTENGFALIVNQADTGIMETDWAENRAKIPQDFIRNTLGKVLDSLYSTSERDKFRTRVERTSSGTTEIYISHRGMEEIYKGGNHEQTTWQPRAVSPELENEFLRRLMVKLGTSAAAAQTAVAAASGAVAPKVPARVGTFNGLPSIELADGFDRAWRRVGLALDRSSFTVEDRDRSQGTYFVRYVEGGADKKSENFLSKLFSSSDATAALQKFRVVLKSEGEKTTVTVASATNAPEAAANAKRIAELIAEELK